MVQREERGEGREGQVGVTRPAIPTLQLLLRLLLHPAGVCDVDAVAVAPGGGAVESEGQAAGLQVHDGKIYLFFCWC